MGLINCLSKFLSKLSELCEPLRRLTHKEVEWKWSVEQEKAFQNMKGAVTPAAVLRYLTSGNPIERQGDASANGIGLSLCLCTIANHNLCKQSPHSQREKLFSDRERIISPSFRCRTQPSIRLW